MIAAILNAVPKWVWIALVAALSATSCKLKWDNGQLSIEVEKHATKVAQLETSIAKSNAAAAEQSAALDAQARAAEQASRKREQAILADAASAKSELERLRVAVSAYSRPRLTASAASIAPGLDYPDPLPDLFVQCSSRYIDLARSADGHANDVKTLMDAWPKGQ